MHEKSGKSAELAARACLMSLTIKELFNRPWDVKIKDVHREAKRAADLMAKFMLLEELGVRTYDMPPRKIQDILFEDGGNNTDY
ncbi:hypothetical protein GOBAR_DD06388 [Gossypium barbadense]|nr:hypothetical protein GOBAR_DD06388 [Gossypium barbadense]